VPVHELRRRGVGSPQPEIRYTALGACLAGVVLLAVRFSAAFVPIADPALRTLVVSGAALSPFALWAAFRIVPEIRAS
jgi:hypothetical protein